MVLALPSLARVLALVDAKCCHMNSVLFSDHNFAIWQSLANDHLSQHSPKALVVRPKYSKKNNAVVPFVIIIM